MPHPDRVAWRNSGPKTLPDGYGRGRQNRLAERILEFVEKKEADVVE
jgi:hypothetical protein